MEHKEHNAEFKTTVNKRFEDLNKLIGPNRAQLSTKVSGVHFEILKELSKEKIAAKRQEEILIEITHTEKMAHKQLPFQLQPKAPAKPVAPAKVKAAVKPKVEKTKPTKPVAPVKAAKKTAAAPKKAAKKK